MKKLAFLFFTLIVLNNLFGQTINSFIYNDSIHYRFGYVGMKFIDDKTIEPSKYIVVINLSKNEKERVVALKKNDWLKLLSNSKTDWAANLLLYNLYKRNAIEYYVNIKNRNIWILLNKKKEEIRYWKKMLK